MWAAPTVPNALPRLRADAGASLVNTKRAEAGAVARSVLAVLRNVCFLEDFGAVGDGVTDDTAAIQAALDAGVPRVMADPTKTYLVSQATTVTINAVTYYACLTLPSGVTLDLAHGATLKLADAENAAIIVNENAGVSQDTDCAVVNGTLDGNQANQTAPASGEMACLFFYDVLRPHVENIVAKNVRQYAGRFLNCDHGYFNHLHCTDSDGDGWSFGTTGGIEFRLFRSFVDNVYAEACIGTYAGLVGNGIIGVFVQCNVGRLVQKDCGAGLKIQNSCEDTSIGSLECYGKVNGSVNSGVKIQGDSGAGVYPTGVAIGRVVAEGCYGRGLTVVDVHSVTIGEYIGRNNGSGAAATGSNQYDADFDLNDGDGPKSCQVGAMFVENNAATIAVRAGTGAGRLYIGSLHAYNVTGIAFQSQLTEHLEIGTIDAVDDQGVPTMTVAFKKTGVCSGKVGRITTNLAHSTSQALVDMPAADYSFEIGQVQLGSSDVLEGVVQLTNASATTSVGCGHVWREYVGGSSDHFHPIIQVVPWDASARALSGNFNCSVADGSSGTGFTINHPTAGAGDFVFWKILGWKVTSQAQA